MKTLIVDFVGVEDWIHWRDKRIINDSESKVIVKVMFDKVVGLKKSIIGLRIDKIDFLKE